MTRKVPSPPKGILATAAMVRAAGSGIAWVARMLPMYEDTGSGPGSTSWPKKSCRSTVSNTPDSSCWPGSSVSDTCRPVRHVEQHVRGQDDVCPAVGQRQPLRIADRDAGSRDRAPGNRDHARRQVHAQQPTRVPAPGQLGQVRPVAAADLRDGLPSGQASEIQHARDQVDPRLLVHVDRLARRQVGVVPVLDSREVVAAGQDVDLRSPCA